MELAYVTSAKDTHFRRPTMSDWLIVRDGYIVLERDPDIRVFLPIDDLNADDWESDISEEQILAEGADETVDLVLRALKDSKSKIANEGIEKLLELRDRILAVSKEKVRRSTTGKVKKSLQPAGGGRHRSYARDDEPDYTED
jgi:hypothetical protein